MFDTEGCALTALLHRLYLYAPRFESVALPTHDPNRTVERYRAIRPTMHGKKLLLKLF
jgi:hypothetical protein